MTTGSAIRYLVIIVTIILHSAPALGSLCAENQTSYERISTEWKYFQYNSWTTYTEKIQKCKLFGLFFCDTIYITRYKSALKQGYYPDFKTIIECCPGYMKNESDICVKRCEPGKYGEQCEYNCTCNDENLYCDDDGQCICPEGYQGTDCTEECDDKHYGRNCEFECECLNNSACDKEHGTCNCTAPGFEGKLCNQKCNSSYFGVYCQEKCTCNKNQTCNPVDGTCTCLPGRTGDNCSKECDEGSYGIDCNNTCECNDNNMASCNVTNGMCNCKPGYMDKHCDHTCKSGTYGQDCLQNCSDNCLPSQVCHFANGTCYCLGSKGYNCSEPCDNGTYGLNCSSTCDCNVNNSNGECNSTTGQCLCFDHWTGQTCDEECDDKHYGRNCKFECQCLNNSTCDIKNGTCNCTSPGFEGKLCNQKCNSSFFGVYCQEKCTCNENQTCNPVDGTCTCLPGRTGDNCSKVCDYGTYGLDCSSTCDCNVTNSNGECNSTTGQCICFDHWTGQTCDEEVVSNTTTSKASPVLEVPDSEELILGLPKTVLMICIIAAGCMLVILILGGAVIYRKKTSAEHDREKVTVEDGAASFRNEMYDRQKGTMNNVNTELEEAGTEITQPNKDVKKVEEKPTKTSVDKDDDEKEELEQEPVIYEDVDDEEGDDGDATNKSSSDENTTKDKDNVADDGEDIYDLANEDDENANDDKSTQATKTVAKVPVADGTNTENKDVDHVVYEDADIEPDKVSNKDDTIDVEEDDYDTTCTNINQNKPRPVQNDEVIYESADEETESPQQNNYHTFREVQLLRLNSKTRSKDDEDDDYNVLDHFPIPNRETRRPTIEDNQYSSFNAIKTSGNTTTDDSGESDYDSLEYTLDKKKKNIAIIHHEDYHHIDLTNKTIDGEQLVAKPLTAKSSNKQKTSDSVVDKRRDKSDAKSDGFEKDNSDESVEKRSNTNNGIKHICSDISEQHYSVCDIDELDDDVNMEEVIYDECDEPEEKTIDNVSDRAMVKAGNRPEIDKPLVTTNGKVDKFKSKESEIYDNVSESDTDEESDDNVKDIDRKSIGLNVSVARSRRRRSEDYEEYDLNTSS